VDQGRIGRPTPSAGGPCCEHGGHGRRLVVGRVAEVAVGDGVAQRVGDRWGDVEVHVGDPGGEHVGRVAAPLRPAAAAQGSFVDRLELGAGVDGHRRITDVVVFIGAIFARFRP
jgi:hypothetical protein